MEDGVAFLSLSAPSTLLLSVCVCSCMHQRYHSYPFAAQTFPPQISMASSATSLHFLSISPQTLSLSKPFVPVFSSVSFPASSLKSLFSLSCSTIGLFGATSSSSYVSRFVKRNVSISSEFDQIGALDEDEPPRPPRFSEDLKLFVGNLPFSADSSVLADLFQRAGNVEMVEVIYDKITGRSRGFGFVTMSTVEEVEAAAQQFDGYELEGRQLRVNFGQGGPSRVNSGSAPPRRDNSSFRGSRGGSSFDDSNRIYVGNLAWGVDNLALETLFSEQGKVLDAKVIYDRDTGRSRGFGFVTYSSVDEVNNAVDSLNGVDLNGREIRVSPAESRTRSEF